MGNLDNPTANQIALERAIYQKGFGDGFTASKKEIPTERCQKCGAWKEWTVDFEGVLHAQKIGVVDKKPQKVGKKNPYTIAAAQILRSIPSKKRIEASRNNGKKGGRPKSNFVVKG